MNPALDALLTRTDAVMQGAYEPTSSYDSIDGKVYAGVDLVTAYPVLVFWDAEKKPIAGDFQFLQVVRDGLVVGFDGAIQLVRQMKAKVEARLGFELVSAASGYPPGVPRAEVRATGYVLEAAGLNCTGLIDEPSAANSPSFSLWCVR
jgi:ethanolamine utilization protein EutJ